MISVAKGEARCRGCGGRVDLSHMISDQPGAISMVGLASPYTGVRVWLGVIVEPKSLAIDVGFACSESCAALCVERGGG